MAPVEVPIPSEVKIEKLPRLPKNARVKKRPLLHAQISSPYAGRDSQKIVYVSAKTPFMAVIRRVQRLQRQIQKREVRSNLSHQKKPSTSGSTEVKTREPEPVVLSSTGKAVEKALSLALFLQQQPGVEVKLVTGSADAIDDIVPQDVNYFSAHQSHNDNDHDIAKPTNDPEKQDAPGALEDTLDLPDSRLRHTSALQVFVTTVLSDTT